VVAAIKLKQRDANDSRAGITRVQVDERYLPIDAPRSNAGMIERTLFAVE
jgi:6-phosphogluconolactonase/glucosamine-6-phosphate isomerase/deaminase